LFDAYEPNYDLEHAADLGVGQTVSLNFNPWPAGHPGPDNDFFRLYVKVGQRLHVETSELAPGLDTNLILYRENGAVIAGNDDCTPGERRSCLDWNPEATGYVFLLVGPVGLTPKAVSAEARAYTLRVIDLAAQPANPSGSGATSTPVYGEPLPWDPAPPPPLDPAQASPVAISPLPTPTLLNRPVQVRTFSLIPPTSTPLPLEPITVELTIYQDANDNKAPDLEEGVSGIGVRVLDPLTNRLLGQTVTDQQGYAQLLITASADEVQLSVAYLGYSQTIRPPGKPVQIRLPALQLPSLIP
jgi:hypothetical protein